MKIKIVFFSIFFGFAVFSWFIGNREQETTLSFFSVGQGDGILFRTKNGLDLVIDGGPDDTMIEKLGRFRPLFDHSIEVVVPTHPDADHITGLIEMIGRYHVRSLLMTQWTKQTPEVDAFQDIVAQKKPEVHSVRSNSTIFLDDEWRFTILSPSRHFQKPNDNGIVALLANQDVKVLFMADVGKAVEEELIKTSPWIFPVDILKVGHHGSCASSDEKFLSIARPKIAVIQVGRDNSYGHPCKTTLARLQEVADQVYRTDIDSDVQFIFKQNQIMKK